MMIACLINSIVLEIKTSVSGESPYFAVFAHFIANDSRGSVMHFFSPPQYIGMDTKVEPPPDFLATKTAASLGCFLMEVTPPNQLRIHSDY
ncbi:MAG: hypothetical protein FWC50_14875 [Planctomycetaceae bacterium]|nr:hypothetical protein [Planctomycetaceae bacterium]